MCSPKRKIELIKAIQIKKIACCGLVNYTISLHLWYIFLGESKSIDEMLQCNPQIIPTKNVKQVSNLAM